MGKRGCWGFYFLEKASAVVMSCRREVVGEDVVGAVVHDAVVEVVGARGHPPEVREHQLREVVERLGDEAEPRVDERAVRTVVHR